MSLFDLPRCPNCNSEIDLKELWRIAPKTNRGSTIEGNVAIVCPVCGIKLRVLQGRAQLSGLLGFGLLIALALIGGHLSSHTGSPLLTALIAAPFVIVAIAGYWIQRRLIPRLLRVRLLEEGEQVVYPLIAPQEVWETEQQVDARDLRNSESSGDNRPVWTCSKCGEKNPGNFDICWKCQAERLGAVAEASNK
jgi:hypothetical protein